MSRNDELYSLESHNGDYDFVEVSPSHWGLRPSSSVAHEDSSLNHQSLGRDDVQNLKGKLAKLESALGDRNTAYNELEAKYRQLEDQLREQQRLHNENAAVHKSTVNTKEQEKAEILRMFEEQQKQLNSIRRGKERDREEMKMMVQELFAKAQIEPETPHEPFHSHESEAEVGHVMPDVHVKEHSEPLQVTVPSSDLETPCHIEQSEHHLQPIEEEVAEETDAREKSPESTTAVHRRTRPPVPSPTPRTRVRDVKHKDANRVSFAPDGHSPPTRDEPEFLDPRQEMTLVQRDRPKNVVVNTVHSKFRHVEASCGTKAGACFSNLHNVNTRAPPEGNFLVVSEKYAAVSLAGAGGVVAILNLFNATKLPDGVPDGIQNNAVVTDMQWSPFDSNLLACGTDQGLVNLWSIPEEKEGENRADLQPVDRMRVEEKVVCLRWHPVASALLAVALSNCIVELWTTSPTPTRHYILLSRSSSILSIAWSSSGRRLATVAKDLELHVWRPQNSTEAPEARLPSAIESPRGARVLFACDDSVLIVIGFTKSSARQITLYNARSSSLDVLYKHVIDTASQPLIPHYDFDSSVLFLSGKGDRMVSMFEVCRETPFLIQINSFSAASGHQAVAFHGKNVCSVMEVEFARAWRLTEKTLELLRFRVPRVKKDVFQSDLFPDALVTWEPATTAERWLHGDRTKPIFNCMRPEGVRSLAVPHS